MEEVILIIVCCIVLISIIAFIIKKKRDNRYKNYVAKENIPVEFKEIYNKLHTYYKEELEDLRKKIVFKYTIFAIVIALLVIITICILPNIFNMTELVIKVITTIYTIIAIIFLVIIMIAKNKYKKLYKEEIISKFVTLIDKGLVYKYGRIKGGLEIARAYKKAQFDNKEFNRCYVDDSVEGILLGNTRIEVFDVDISYVRERNQKKDQKEKKKKKQHRTKKIFQGIFVMAISQRDVETTVKITKNKLRKANNKERVQMDSGEFEEYFDVYAEDKIIAMRILTSEVMQCLIEFQNKYSLDFEIVFKNNVIYLRFFTGPMFEPKIIGDAMDEGLIFRYYTILKFIIDITQTVNASKKDLDI